MTLPWAPVAELLALGLCAGFLAGLLGIGGGMLMVPVLSWLFAHRGVEPGFSIKMAVASSMATITFTALSSLRAHHLRGAVLWPIVRAMGLGIVAGALVGGAGVFVLVKGRWLALLFALFVGYAAHRMGRPTLPSADRHMPGPAGQFAAGAGIGFASALVGAGGAFLSVPFMTRHNVGIHDAVGTGAALGFPIALASTVGYVVGGASLPAPMQHVLPGSFGYLYLPAIFILTLGTVGMAPLGARVAHALNVVQLRRVFALLLYALSAYMLFTAFEG